MAQFHLAVRRHHADGAHAGRALAQRRPDLTQENRDRGLAVGAGDGGDGLGLGGEELRGDTRQRPARILVGDEAYAERRRAGCDVGPAEHGHRAAAHRVVHVRRAVRLGSRQRRKQIARTHLAAVAREASELSYCLHGAFAHLTRRDVRARMWSHYEFSLATVMGFIGTPAKVRSARSHGPPAAPPYSRPARNPPSPWCRAARPASRRPDSEDLQWERRRRTR